MRSRLPLLLVGGGVLPLYALFTAHTTLFEAGERMDRILVVDVVANGALLAGVAAALWTGGGVMAVIGVVVAGQGLAALVAWLLLRRSGLLAPPQEPVSLSPRTTLRRALPFFGIAAADVVQQRADLLLLSAVAPPAVTGLYAAASSLVRVGIRLVAATWRALYPTLSRLRDADAVGFARLDALAVRALALLTLPAAAVGTAVSGPLALALFGPEYALSGRTLALLLWSLPLYAWEVRCATLLAAVRRPRDGLIAALAHVGGLVLLLPPLAAAWGSPGAALAALAAGVGGAGVGTWMLARAGLLVRGGALLRPALAALAGGAAAWLLPVHWVGQAAAGAAAFAAAAWLLGALAADDLLMLRRALRPARP
jgi:O-antigen/teichoic acid export membrane protein